MTMTTSADSPARTVTSKEAHRNWKLVTDKALRAPVVITAHGRPRHVLMAYEDYERLRLQTRRAYWADRLPADLAGEILDGMAELRAPIGRTDDGGGDRDILVGRRQDLAALCRHYGVSRLEIFGSAARGGDFDPEHSDIDFLVTFGEAARNDLDAFAGFKLALEALFGRPVDLVEREAVEASRNYIRRRRILSEAQPVYG
jgi:prevent-host-death family protein